MSTAEIRPVATREQERLMMLGWVRAVRNEIAAAHRAQEKLSKLEFHLSQPPFPVAQPPAEAKARIDNSGAVVAWATIGAALFAAAGAALPSASWAIVLCIIGALALTLAFDRSDAA